MIKTYRPPVTLHISSVDTDRSVDLSDTGGSNQNVLYKKVTPRKKKDTFGRDTTNYATYFLSSTLSPTAVRATLLADMQKVDPKICSFDIVEKPKTESSRIVSKPTSMPLAPPPSLVSKRHPSIVSKTHSEMLPEEPGQSECDGSVEPINSINKENTPRKQDLASSTAPSSSGQLAESSPFTDRSVVQEGQGHQSAGQGHDRDRHEKVSRLRAKMAEARKSKSVPSSTTMMSGLAVPRINAFNQMRLIRYSWKSREIRVAEERKDGGEIRDPMYLHTYCPDERPVRYQKTSLPVIGRTPRSRPWTVSESTVKARLSTMTNKGHKSAQVYRSSKRLSNDVSCALRGHPSTNQYLSKSAGHFRTRHDTSDGEEEDDVDDEDNKALLEIRPFLANSCVADQRDKLKGTDGCLNSRVKQCVRFVRYREKLDRQGDERPMKHEGGRYRPFSKTDVRNHALRDPSPSPEAKLQKSVETYQKYMENISRETNIVSSKKSPFRNSNHSSRQPSSFTAQSSGVDTDSIIVQSVADSNLPTDFSFSSSKNQPSLGLSSAIYTKDVSGMDQALEIKRLSPKKTPNRVVAGSRHVNIIQDKSEEPSPRVDSESTDEGVDLNETGVVSGAIVVPHMPAKSECASEYSIARD